MEIRQSGEDSIQVVFTSNPNASEAEEWNLRLREALQGTEKQADVDLTGMKMISSMGINVIVGLYKMLERQGGNIRVRVNNEKMLHIFELFKLDKLFPVEVAQ